MAKSHWLMAASAVLVSGLVLTGCGKKSGSTGEKNKKTVITNSGSDTMVNLAQAWAEGYHGAKPEVSVEVSGGGSGIGIRDLISGMVDMANSSRDMSETEKTQAKQNTGKDVMEWKVGYDALAVYVFKNNPMNEISIDQLAQIYGEKGTIETWSALGVDLSSIGGNDKIERVSRQNNSGTYVYFREHVLNKQDFKQGSLDLSGSKDVVELVGKTPGAIGYSGMGYADETVKMLKVSPKTGEPAVEASLANALSGKYPLARPLLIITLGQPEGAVKEYIDWILSPAGQKIVEESGYVPLSSATPTAPANP